MKIDRGKQRQKKMKKKSPREYTKAKLPNIVVLQGHKGK
jgi:hypothetical protein